MSSLTFYLNLRGKIENLDKSIFKLETRCKKLQQYSKRNSLEISGIHNTLSHDSLKKLSQLNWCSQKQ